MDTDTHGGRPVETQGRGKDGHVMTEQGVEGCVYKSRAIEVLDSWEEGWRALSLGEREALQTL